MSNVLLVIDMQESFVSHDNEAYSEAIKNTAREISAAKARDEHIVFVEFFYPISFGNVLETHDPFYSNETNKRSPTLKELRDLVDGYEKTLFVYKMSTDGGTEVVQALRENNIPATSIRVCGAYTAYCVSETVQTMALKLRDSRVKLVGDALASYAGRNYPDWKIDPAITYLTSIDNVELHDATENTIH